MGGGRRCSREEGQPERDPISSLPPDWALPGAVLNHSRTVPRPTPEHPRIRPLPGSCTIQTSLGETVKSRRASGGSQRSPGKDLAPVTSLWASRDPSRSPGPMRAGSEQTPSPTRPKKHLDQLSPPGEPRWLRSETSQRPGARPQCPLPRDGKEQRPSTMLGCPRPVRPAQSLPASQLLPG